MRILFFVHPGDHTRLVLRDFVKGFETAGHEVMLLELAPLWQEYVAAGNDRGKHMANASTNLTKVIAENKIDATCGMEALGLNSFAHSSGRGRPQTVFDLARVPHLCFWLEAPHFADAGRYQPLFGSPLISTKAMVHLVDNAPVAREMRERLGFGTTISMPWAVEPSTYPPHPEAAPEFDLVVSCGKGDPMPTPEAMRQLDQDEPDMMAIRKDMISHIRPHMKAMAKQSPKPAEVEEVLERLIQSQLERRNVPVLNRLEEIAAQDYKLSEGFRTLCHPPAALVQAGRIVRNVEISERAFTISWLSRRFKTLVFGENKLAPWNVKAEQITAVHTTHVSKTIARGRVGVNLTRWHDDAGLGTRPFEIAASGVAAVSHRRPGLQDCFVDGQEMLMFDTPQEGAKAIQSLLADQGKRSAMAEAGRNRVLKDHTWASRVPAIVKALEAAKVRLA